MSQYFNHNNTVFYSFIFFLFIYRCYHRTWLVVTGDSIRIQDETKGSLTHYQTTILDSSKLKEVADDNFKFDENGKKLSKWVENTVGKGEIARCEQFLLFP